MSLRILVLYQSMTGMRMAKKLTYLLLDWRESQRRDEKGKDKDC